MEFWKYFEVNWIPYCKNITQIYRRNCFSLNSTNNINEHKFKILTKRKQKNIKRLDELILKIIEITENDNYRKQFVVYTPTCNKIKKKS